jgi:hypothetical protein
MTTIDIVARCATRSSTWKRGCEIDVRLTSNSGKRADITASQLRANCGLWPAHVLGFFVASLVLKDISESLAFFVIAAMRRQPDWLVTEVFAYQSRYQRSTQ